MTMKQKPTRGRKTVRAWALEDAVHFIIYRELDKLGVSFAYQNATMICRELREAVSYRSVTFNPRKKA